MARVFYFLLFLVVLAARLCHSGIVWVEEGYPLAAAREMLRGETPYRDFWFDKPPLFPAFYMLWGALASWPLRVAGALFVVLSAWSVGRFARWLWGEVEERYAALLLAFALTFWIPSAVLVIGPDLMLIPVQTAAVMAAWRGKALAAGLLVGSGMLINAKMLFLLPAAFVPRPAFAIGFLAPQMVLLPVAGEYWRQVWSWGAMYSRDTFIGNPLWEGMRRTAHWVGFHACAVVGAGLTIWREPMKRRWILWMGAALAAVIVGFRFAPRYYFLLLPPVILLGARAVAQNRRWLLVFLLIPLIRFGPRYVQLGADLAQGKAHVWSDLAMEQDSRAVAAYLREQGSGDLLVWGYRPEIYVLSGAPAATRFLDSQPLTGVLADRHLTDSRPAAPELAADNRRALTASAPMWIVDGLTAYNPRLAITEFEDLREWLGGYEEVRRTEGSVIYRRR